MGLLMIPFGTPVDPDVYMTTATSSLEGLSTGEFTKRNKKDQLFLTY